MWSCFHSHRSGVLRFTGALTAVLLLSTALLIAQTTVSQGSIQGTVTDPSGAVVGGATVTITNEATGQVVSTRTTSAGAYSSGALLPGEYFLRVEAKGFKATRLPVTVQVGVTASGNVKLEIGQESQVVEVQANTVQVNTEQATVQGVLSAKEIDNMPVDGRNFLDLAQLEPGVQIQDGTTFDPTKAGYSSISINSVYGRTPRIELDGLDVSDENVGTTTQNIGLGSIQEFNISRSSLDLSTELTSSGAVNITTRSGTNGLHGQGFYNFRDRNAWTAPFPGGVTSYYQRNNYGGRIGGPIIPNKLFFFINAERMKQDGFSPVVAPSTFNQLSGGFPAPFRDNVLTGKLDWQASSNIHLFYRFTYNWNRSVSTYYGGYPVYANRDNTPSQAMGLDWNQGSWSHSVRFGYLKFHNEIVDGLAGSSIYNPLPRDGIDFLGSHFFLGPNLLAPQGTFQSNKQFKYDGSKVWGSHILRFGAGFNRILGGGFANFFGLAPLLLTSTSTCPNSDPTQCLLLDSYIGNGQGYFTEKPGFGLPAGGQEDWRFQWYVGDSWKIKPRLTLTYGLRYNRDTGRADSDLSPIPCSAVDVPGPAPCSGDTQLLDQFGFTRGLGDRVRQPNSNFGPQVGFAWDMNGNGKTVIRGGAGIYYENSVFNNTLFDRPGKLAAGLFNSESLLGCSGGGVGTTAFTLAPGNTVTSVDGVDLATGVCGQPLSVAGPLVADLQEEFQAAVTALGATANPNFVGNTLQFSNANEGYAAYAPNYRTTRSYQMNIGMQRQLGKGVLTVDYLRNISLRFPLTIDVNHVGDARYLNTTAAQNAIAATTDEFGCGGGFSSAEIDCAISGGATIDDFAGNGLDSGLSYLAGYAASVFGLTPDEGAAFAGINPLMGQGDFQYPIGRSVYNALQTSYRQQVTNPMRGLDAMDLTIAYTLSRFVTNGGNDQNFSALAWDNNNPTYYMGPSSLDRTHEFKFGLTVNVAHHGPQFSVDGVLGSPHPQDLLMYVSSQEDAAGIFHTDFTGDGTIGDILPTKAGQSAGLPGQFDRSVTASGLANAVNAYNSTQAGTLTPAGQALVGAGLFSTGQLQALGAVKPYVASPPANQVNNGAFRDFSMVLSWPVKIGERFTIEPSISAYNVFNLANFGRLGQYLDNQTTPYAPGQTGIAGTITNTVPGASRDVVRLGLGSGVFSQGSPRQVEFGLRFSF
jgi:Carboxypeptidase regulatory-like domain